MDGSQELPKMYYKCNKFIARFGPQGEPWIIAFQPSETVGSILEPVSQPIGITVILLHPDNLERLRGAVEGTYTLIEWEPNPKQKPSEMTIDGEYLVL